MSATDTVVIGAGQAGLAASHHLSELGRDHVVLERGRLAERWWSERWDSLRLLTPNWMTRLPGWSYSGPDPDGFMTVSELIAFFGDYARSFGAPVREETTVELVERVGDHGYRVVTDQGTWQAQNVIVATGETGRPYVPPIAGALARDIHQTPAGRYRSPAGLPDGGVLVVGASASGTQIADELRAHGRDVVLAVGSHTRMPRRYRGFDVMWWLDRLGVFDVTIDEVRDPDRARRAPSFQLSGRSTCRDIDLAHLASTGVTVTGRLSAADGATVGFDDDLGVNVDRAESRMHRVLDGIDAHIEAAGLTREVLDSDRPDPVAIAATPEAIDLRAAGITNVVWATGYQPHNPYLRVPVFGPRDELVQQRGVTVSPGLYVLGLRFMHHRNSTFIDGVGRDARFVVDHLAGRSGTQPITAAHAA